VGSIPIARSIQPLRTFTRVERSAPETFCWLAHSLEQAMP